MRHNAAPSRGLATPPLAGQHRQTTALVTDF